MLAPWVLIEQFAPIVTRVINVTSGGMYAQALNSGDLTSERDTYNPKRFYARTKRAEMVITEQWAERLRDTVVHAMHPGWVDTKGVQSFMPVFRKLTRPILRGLDAGADTVVWLGAAPEPLHTTGELWMDRRRRPTHYRFGASRQRRRPRGAMGAARAVDRRGRTGVGSAMCPRHGASRPARR